MIIEVRGATQEGTALAGDQVRALAGSWGVTAEAMPADAVDSEGSKVIDPVAVGALVLSIPSAVLAVADITDRILKRRRAQQFIDHADQAAAGNISITVLTRRGLLEIRGLTADQLLELTQEPDTPEAASGDSPHTTGR